MQTELAKSESKAVGAPIAGFGLEESSAANLLIPRILTVQNTSKMLVKWKAAPGDFRESLEGKCLAKVTEPLEFIPFYLTDSWFHSKKEKDRWVFDKVEPRKNENYEYIEKNEAGVEVAKHEKVINAFVLLPSELKEKGPAALPYLLSFRGAQTFKEGGQKLATLAYQLKRAGKGPASHVFTVVSNPYSNEKGNFYVLEVKQGRATTAEELQAAFDWYQQIRASRDSIRVDDESLKTETEETTAGEGKF